MSEVNDTHDTSVSEDEVKIFPPGTTSDDVKIEGKMTECLEELDSQIVSEDEFSGGIGVEDVMSGRIVSQDDVSDVSSGRTTSQDVISGRTRFQDVMSIGTVSEDKRNLSREVLSQDLMSGRKVSEDVMSGDVTSQDVLLGTNASLDAISEDVATYLVQRKDSVDDMSENFASEDISETTVLEDVTSGLEVSRDVTEIIALKYMVSEEKLLGDGVSKDLASDDVLSVDMSDDSMSRSDSYSVCSSDDSDMAHDIVTDDSMSEDENDTLYEMITCDANIVNNGICTNEYDSDVEQCQRDPTTYYILNLATDPEKFEYNAQGPGGITDEAAPSTEKDCHNDKKECSGTENTFRSRLARFKAFFSKKEKCETQISTESDSGITQDAAEDLEVSRDESPDIKCEVVESCLARSMTDDIGVLRHNEYANDISDDSDSQVDIPDDSSEGFYSLKDEGYLAEEVVLVAELQDTINSLHSEYLAWRKSRMNSIKEINVMADSLDGHQRNVDIAKVTGTSVGAAATVAGIVFTSLALAPVTAGSSLFVGLGIGAGVVGGAGVGTGIGAVVTKKKLERGKWERLQQIVTQDQEVTDSLRMTIERYDQILTSVTNLVKEKEELGTARTILLAVRGTHTLAEKITVSVLKDVIRSAAGVTTEAVDGGAKAALVAGRVLGGIGIALGGIALVIDIIYLVQVGRNIRSGSKCDVAKRLRSVAEVLEEEMEKIDEVLAFDLAMSSSRTRADISRSAIYDIHDLGEDDMELNEMTFGKLHIDTSIIDWSDEEFLD